MLPTGNQLSKGMRIEKKRRNRVAAWVGPPIEELLKYAGLVGNTSNRSVNYKLQLLSIEYREGLKF